MKKELSSKVSRISPNVDKVTHFPFPSMAAKGEADLRLLQNWLAHLPPEDYLPCS
jgi:hypothetical protein